MRLAVEGRNSAVNTLVHHADQIPQDRAMKVGEFFALVKGSSVDQIGSPAFAGRDRRRRAAIWR